MDIILNGEKKQVAEGLTVKKLLETLNIKTELVAIELNLKIVPKSEYASQVINTGDKIEIISFVGGG